jgi:hypothetical protein
MVSSSVLRRSRAIVGLFVLVAAAITGAAVNQRQVLAAGVDVYVGYADSLRASPTNFPTPWAGSPNTTFEGCQPASSCSYDGGAVRIVNNSASPITVNAVAVHVDTCTYTPWPSASLAPGAELIVAQLATGATAGCSANSPPVLMDTSDVGKGGSAQLSCTQDGITPTVDVTIDGTLTTFSDTGRVINTGGIDLASCPPGTNESTQWTIIGRAPCAGSSLTLAPASQSHTVGTLATITATFTNSCGAALSNVSVSFKVTSGPNNGLTGTGVTDASGNASFTYTSASTGTDTWIAQVTNPAGTITSNSVSVIWTAKPVATTVTLSPATKTNTVGTSHTVTATVKDQFGNLMGGVKVYFTVTGDVNTTGSCTTASSGPALGTCTFTYSGPILPGADAIKGCANSPSGPPCGAATKVWVLPVSNPLCTIDITNGGWMIANDTDKVTFGGTVHTDQAGAPSGEEQYTDSPANLDVHSINILAITCSSNLELADIYGTATENGTGTHAFRIEVTDPDSTSGADSYWIFIDNYNSGSHSLGGGNVEIHHT